MVLTKIQTLFKLGVVSLVRLALYKLSLRTGLNPVKRINHPPIDESLFYCDDDISGRSSQVPQITPFGWMKSVSLDNLDWSRNLLTEQVVHDSHLPWYQIPDFDPAVGDIKGVWEASRFSWAPALAKSYCLGDTSATVTLNQVCGSWMKNNPFYLGPNWKCGQEASIRVIHLAYTAKLLDQVDNSKPSLLAFIKAHLMRIAPTVLYAVAQNNNHGTSEATALFIGGSWLLKHGDPQGEKWQKQGRYWLENRAKCLIENDGSFSQYSSNYHRLMLDSYSLAELWRQSLDLEPFKSCLYTRLGAATNWLYQLTDSKSGDIPNLGANDGAWLLPISGSDYRDFRPTVAIASHVFLKKHIWTHLPQVQQSYALLALTASGRELNAQTSFHFPDGGYFGLRNSDNTAFALVNYPRFRFRPSQCDALHVDFWVDGVNVLRDGGTYSYNAGQELIDYYGGVASHCSVQFDDHDQMPRLSRFLFGDWLSSRDIQWNADLSRCQASYIDSFECSHKRNVTLTENALIVRDTLSGFKEKAVLRWRLAPGMWHIEGRKVYNKEQQILISCDSEIVRFELVDGRESRYYYQERTIPVLEIEVKKNAQIVTEYQYKQ